MILKEPMKFALISACSNSRVIGSDNTIPWSVPEELAYFKGVTMNKVMIMGRKTYDSIGRGLPGRTTIVLTQNVDWKPHEKDEDTVVAYDGWGLLRVMCEALRRRDRYEVMIVGGEQIYRTFLPFADRVYLTHVDVNCKGDAYFPSLSWWNWDCWSTVQKTHNCNTGKQPVACDYKIYDRRFNITRKDVNQLIRVL